MGKFEVGQIYQASKAFSGINNVYNIPGYIMTDADELFKVLHCSAHSDQILMEKVSSGEVFVLDDGSSVSNNISLLVEDYITATLNQTDTNVKSRHLIRD